MKLRKIFNSLLILSTVGLNSTVVLTSCDSSKSEVKSIDGSNWEGVVEGKFHEEDYVIDQINKTITYTNGSGICASNLVIPNYVKYQNTKYKVLLGELCFFQNTYILYSVELNDFILDIPRDCFNGCTRLTTVIFHDYPQTFDVFAFYKCSNLKDIYVKQNNILLSDWTTKAMYFGESSFEQTNVGGNFAFGSPLMQIGKKAFYQCNNITNVNLSFANQLSEIGDYAFYGCKHIANVYLPEKIKKIGDSAFCYCESLVRVYPYSDDLDLSIGDYAFSYCSRFIGFDKNINIVNCGKACFSNDTQFSTAYWNRGNKLKIIDVGSFYNTGFTAISILPQKKGGPNDIYTLAFGYCSNLHIIDVSYFDSVPTWTGEYIFQGLPEYGTIYVSDDVWNHGDVAQEWYDFFEAKGLNMEKKGEEDPSKVCWHFEYQ